MATAFPTAGEDFFAGDFFAGDFLAPVFVAVRRADAATVVGAAGTSAGIAAGALTGGVGGGVAGRPGNPGMRSPNMLPACSAS